MRRRCGSIPTFSTPYYNRGLIHGDRDELEQALADFSRAIELDPDYADAYFERGRVYGRMDKDDAAISDYGQTIKLDPDYAAAYAKRGVIYKYRGEYDLALADFDRVVKLTPDDAGAFVDRPRSISTRATTNAASRTPTGRSSSIRTKLPPMSTGATCTDTRASIPGDRGL